MADRKIVVALRGRFAFTNFGHSSLPYGLNIDIEDVSLQGDH